MPPIVDTLYIPESQSVNERQLVVSREQSVVIIDRSLQFLDQVKMEFDQQPDVYHRFLDTMTEYRSRSIDTHSVVNRVGELFNGHPTLIQNFNTFLPPGYRIEICDSDIHQNGPNNATP